jgi:hypothetical protein
MGIRRGSWNFGQSIGRNFDYSFDAVNTHVLQPINNAVVKPVVRAANTYVVEPFNYGASTAVNYYTDLVAQGQQEGGVGGLIKQGAGYLGGTFASVPGATAQFIRANGTRIGGGVKAVGGAIQVGVGLGTTATLFGAPIGAPVVANGVDNLQAGLRQLWTGENTNTLLYDSIKRVTDSDKLAGTVDVATNAVLNTATAVDAARRAATLADARTVAAEAAVLRQEVGALVQAERAAAAAGSASGLDSARSGFAAFSRWADEVPTLGQNVRANIGSNGFFDVIAHGTTQAIQVQTARGAILVNHRVAARLIQNRLGTVSQGKNLKLLSCRTGCLNDGFAQNLANKMNVTVMAPSDLLWAKPSGELFIRPGKTVQSRITGRRQLVPDYNVSPGEWRTFDPGGN